MLMAGRVILGIANPALDSNGSPLSGATLTFYEAGTVTLGDIYSTNALGPALSNPLAADASGRYPMIWAADNTSFDVVWKTAAGAVIDTFDDIAPEAGGGGFLYRDLSNPGTVSEEDAEAFREAIGAAGIDGDQVSLMDYGAVGNGVADDTAAIQSALSYCDANKKTLYVPDGSYRYTALYVDYDYVCIRGAGRPSVVADLSALEGGARFIGTMFFRGEHVDIESCGFDHGIAAFPVTQNDALVLQRAIGEQGRFARLFNVIGLGRASSDAFHAIAVEGYQYLTGGDCIGIRNVYGASFKVDKSNFGNFLAISNGTRGVIIKADSGFANVVNANFGNIVVIGTGTTGYGVSILNQSADLDMANVTVGNVTATGVGIIVGVEAEMQGGTYANISELTIGNITGSCYDRGFYCGEATGGIIYSVTHGDINVSLTANGARAADYTSGNIVMAGNILANVPSTSTVTAEVVRVGAAVGRFSAGRVVLPVEYSDTVFAGCTFSNAANLSTIDPNSSCTVAGVGAPPKPGLLLGSKTHDPGSLADGAGESTTVSVPGAALGDFASASFSLDAQGVTLSAWVNAADSVTVRFQNETGGVVDLASGTLRARVNHA